MELVVLFSYSQVLGGCANVVIGMKYICQSWNILMFRLPPAFASPCCAFSYKAYGILIFRDIIFMLSVSQYTQFSRVLNNSKAQNNKYKHTTNIHTNMHINIQMLNFKEVVQIPLPQKLQFVTKNQNVPLLTVLLNPLRVPSDLTSSN
jgi:hypothetical protein